MKFYSLDEEEKYVLEFILKNDKNITVENSKAVFNLIIENDENDFKGVITNKDFELLYKELKEEYNFQNFAPKEFARLKLKEIINKEDYSGNEKEDIINDLKEKIMDELF